MTTKVTISVDGGQQRGIAVIEQYREGGIGDVHDVMPGQTGEFHVHSHQRLSIQEIEPLEEGKPSEPEDIIPPAAAVVPIAPVVGSDGVAKGVIAIAPADMSVPVIPVEKPINTVDSINENTTTIQSGVIDPVTEEVEAITAEDIKDESGAVVVPAGTTVTVPATDTQTIEPSDVGSVHALLDTASGGAVLAEAATA